MSRETYESPFSSRYASEEMLRLFSPDSRYGTWRKLWTELARAERALGLPITEEQVDELEAHQSDIDYELVEKREKEVKHDVMAHVYAYGKAAPSAAGIIHLGATSCYVTDNADLILFRDALKLIRRELLGVMKALAVFADQYKSLPAPGYTHYQPAQPVTVGKRAALWLQNFAWDLEELDFTLGRMKMLGCRGATGTEASFASLFGGENEKADRLNGMLCASFGFPGCVDVCGQTYPRKTDASILNVLSAVGQSACKFAADVRLLQHDGQISESFGKEQIGSSAMPYKRNPVRCERICSLARLLPTYASEAAATASAQWLERTLDDSAGRRVYMPEAFLCADAVLRLVSSVASGLSVNERALQDALNAQMPFFLTEDLMMEAVRRGGDRQKIHGIIRDASMRAKEEQAAGRHFDLPSYLLSTDAFGMTEEELREKLDPALYVGRCAEQTEKYLQTLAPVLAEADDNESDPKEMLV